MIASSHPHLDWVNSVARAGTYKYWLGGRLLVLRLVHRRVWLA
ncbi:hypothetical protein HMPREF0388_0646 [Mobiluncus curtisii ATCC 51333]|uniref:Uncharacterized protein n=1 Tax=Mobiluncus curtisii ATCC 51333 TaxID=887326 RepID=E6LXQ9_9ACTO|nr:hypothetical protein HMPREF0388_0646 [Mobiluncus curtisii ATCC 51333]